MDNNFQISQKFSRRALLRGILSAAILASSSPIVVAKEAGLFGDKPEEQGGIFSGLAEKIGKHAKGTGKRGKYAEVLFQDLQNGDEKARLELYTRAQDGDDYARTIVGWMFDNGYHAALNSFQAAQMFFMAAPKIALANYNLGVLFLHGRGVVRDEKRAMTCFDKAERIGPAFVQLANYALREGKGNTALHFARIAAELKDPAGMYLCARLLLEKGESDAGLRMMTQAAGSNYPQAIESMIVIYEKGIGAKVNSGQAAGWWVVDQVLNRKQTLQQAEAALSRLTLNSADRHEAMRFARRWLTNRTALAPFDYERTLNFQDLKGVGPRLL